MGFCSAFLLILITIFLPPVGVLMVAGCGADFLINICLTILGYIPGHIHAFYLEYQYYHRRDLARGGAMLPRATGVYSERIQHPPGSGAAVPPQGYAPPPQQYGTV